MIDFPTFRFTLTSPGIVTMLACVFLFGAETSAQTFDGEGGLVIPPGAPGQTVGITMSSVQVSGIGTLGDGCTQIENVTMDVLHTWVGDIAIFLLSPDGLVLELTSGNGGSGNDFSITIFTDDAPTFITQGAPPYNGSFRPEGRQQSTTPPFPNGNPLGTFTFQNTFDGVDADGEWILLINDYVAADVGLLNSWSITFSSGGGTPPEVSLGPDLTVCPGQTSTLSPTVDPSADTYEWNTGQTTPSIDVNPTETTTYIVTVTNDGCIASDTIEVIVDPNGVIADAGADVSLCQGASVTLSGDGGGPGAIYTWSTGQTGENISVTPNTTTTYTLTVSDGACSATDQVVVTVIPEPNADAGPDVEICEGESILLEASGGVQNNDYAWSTGQSGPNISVNPTTTTLYTVTVDIDGCIDVDEVLVTVLEAPTVDAGPPEEICAGESVTLIATGSGGNYLWSNGQTGDEITVNPLNTTTYTVTLTADGCEAIDDVEVEVINVQANAGPNQFICEGAAATLTATGGTSYEWSTGQTQATISVSPLNTTTYTVTVSQGNCFDIASVEVEVVPNPTASVTPDQVICEGLSVGLTASGGTAYQWSTGQTGSDITVSPVMTTTYTVTVSNQGCFSVATTTVEVNPAPDISAGDDQQICDGGSVVLTATGLFGSGEYTWSTGETEEEIEVDPASTTTYTVTGTNEFDCTATDEVIVTVNPIPTASAGPDQDICDGGTAILNASGGSINATYLWSSGQAGQSVQVSPGLTTTYTLTVTDAGCSSSDEVEVVVLAAPLANAGDDEEICAGSTVELEATGGGTYLWSTGESSSTISITPQTTTTLFVTVLSANGCTDTDEVLILVNPSPSADAGPDQIICDGDAANLSGSGGGSYAWSTGENSSQISVSPILTTSYILTVTDALGCSATDVVSVVVEPVPSANAGPNQFVLLGENAVLMATGGSSFLWSTGETTSQITVTPTVTTTYTVTVTTGSCSAVDEVTVFVDEVPTVDLGPDVEICAGETVMLDALIAGPFTLSYLWSTGESGSSIEVSPVVDTSYSVTVTNTQSGFFSADTIQVTVNQLPIGTPEITGSGVVCEGGVSTYFTLSVAGASLYQWSVGPGGTILSGQGSQQIEVMWSSVGAGEVQLIVSNLCGALPAVAYDQIIDGPPVLQGPVTGELAPCAALNSEYQIAVVSNATNYQWSLTGGGIISAGQGSNAVVIDWNNSTGGDLCVVAANSCGASSPVCLTIQTSQTPVLDAGPAISGCDLSVLLEGSGVGTWSQISGPGTAQFTDPDNPSSQVVVDQYGIYMFSYAIDQSGCFAEDETTVSFFEEPFISGLVAECADDFEDYTIAFDISGGQPPYVVNGQNITGSTFLSNLIPAGTPYSFQVVDDNGCSSDVVSGMEECSCLSDAGQMPPDLVTACLDEKISLNYSGTGVNDGNDTLVFVLYENIFPEGIIAWNTSPEFEFDFSMIAGQTYFVAAVMGNAGVNGWPDLADPCLSISNATPVVFFDLPVASTQDQAVLPCDPAEVMLDIGASDTGPGIVYTWSAINGGVISGSPNASVITALTPGVYILRVEADDTGCASADSIEVTASIVNWSVELGPDTTIQAGETISLIAEVDADIQVYNWYDADPCSTCASIAVTPSSTTTYVVEVEDINGCKDSDEITISVITSKEIFIPNVFSPNGDQVNDIFFIPQNERVMNIQLFEIYDRWGNRVFENSAFLTGDISAGWDGMFRGKPLNPGVFTYRCVVEFNDQDLIHLAGSITLIR